MGGSGGGGPAIGPGIWDPNGSSPCEELRFQTTLANPVSDIVNSLSAGEILAVRKGETNGNLFVAAHHSSGLAGYILSDKLSRLLACIEEGHQYDARVVQNCPPACTVEVYHR